MSLSWSLSDAENPFVPADRYTAGCRFHHAESVAVDDHSAKNELEVALEKAVALLNANVKNESRYFMVEWHLPSSTLRLAVTNDTKSEDGADVVTLRFTALNEQLQAAGESERELHSEKVQFWVKDFLSTCAGFMDYSLVAVFTDGVRDRVRML